MTSDPQKTVAGALVFGASALAGSALLIDLAGGVGVSWTAEALGELWRRATLVGAPGTPLTRAMRQAFEQAVAQVEAAYSREAPAPDAEAFRDLRGCAPALDEVLIARPGDLDPSQLGLRAGLARLLEDRPALPFVQAQLLPAAARALQAALAGDQEAWRLYHGWLLGQIAEQSAEQARSSAATLERIDTVLAALADQGRAVAALEAAAERLAQLAASPPPQAGSVKFSNRDVDLKGGLHQAGGDLQIGSPAASGAARPAPPRPPRDVLFDNEGMKVGGNMYQAGGDIAIGPETPPPPPAPPPALALTLQLTPTAAGARVRWGVGESGSYTSDFATPYRGEDLAAVLRALERQQHPAFALADGDLERLGALGLTDGGHEPPDDLPQRVGRALFDALAGGPGAEALAQARSEALAARCPLALRLLLPPDAVELAALPWELLWPRQQLPLLLSGEPRLLLTRHLDLDGPLPPMPERGDRPLRILALTPHAQRDPDDLTRTRGELARLWSRLETGGIARVTEVSPVTRDELARAMREPHDIVQFTGHGWYAEGRGVLLLDAATPGAPAALADADEVAGALRGARMVVLSACRGAQGAGIEAGSASLLTGVAPALSAAGVPLVVGMQLGVSVTGALRAAEAIYSALGLGLSAQAAVARARDELYVLEPERQSWYVPTLYVRTRQPGPVAV